MGIVLLPNRPSIKRVSYDLVPPAGLATVEVRYIRSGIWKKAERKHSEAAQPRRRKATCDGQPLTLNNARKFRRNR